MSNAVPFSATVHVRDTCLCLHAQRAARVLARRFDIALRPVRLTNQQFSLLMSLNRPEPPPMGPVAALLGMDRTNLTAALKPLERRGLVTIVEAGGDKRRRLLKLTAEGLAVLEAALPIWERVHGEIETAGDFDPGVLRAGLSALSST